MRLQNTGDCNQKIGGRMKEAGDRIMTQQLITKARILENTPLFLRVFVLS
jgi:hypothetical protein